MRFSISNVALFAVALATGSVARAQSQLVIAVPQLPTPKNVETEGGQSGVIGIQIAPEPSSPP